MLVLPECVIPIEFKVSAKKFERLDYEQSWDFRMDLKTSTPRATRHGERSHAAHAVFLFGKARWWRCCGTPPRTALAFPGWVGTSPASSPARVCLRIRRADPAIQRSATPTKDGGAVP